MIREIKLNDGKTVQVEPKISIHALRRFQKEGLLPESLLAKFVGAEKNPGDMEPYLINSAWLAFVNKNPNTSMTQDDFEDKLNLDFELFGQILAEMVSGSVKADATMAQGFRQSTKKGHGKKGHQRNRQK